MHLDGWCVVVLSANSQDYDGAKGVFEIVFRTFKRIKIVFADSAYGRMKLPAWLADNSGCILQTVLRPVGVNGFVILPKRWIVEHSDGSGDVGVTAKTTNEIQNQVTP